MTLKYRFPQAFPHGEIQEVFPDVFFVTGSLAMPGKLPIRASRNMTILRYGDELTLVNSVRLSPAGLDALQRLGKIKHVLRIAGFHGMDDPFYRDQFDCKVWAIKGHFYQRGFETTPTPEKTFFQPDVEMDESTPLPMPDAQLYVFHSSKPPEGLILLKRENGILISGDCFQNWTKTDAYFSWLAKVMMKGLGFIRPHNVGPGWLKIAKPAREELEKSLALDFTHVLPAHGTPALNSAKPAYQDRVAKLKPWN